MLRTALLALVAAHLLSCAHGSYSMLSTERPSARPPDCPLEIFTAESEIGRSFKKLCLINSTSGAMATTDEALKSARRQACECGAEALLIDSVGGTGNRFSGKSVNATTYGIIFTDSDSP